MFNRIERYYFSIFNTVIGIIGWTIIFLSIQINDYLSFIIGFLLAIFTVKFRDSLIKKIGKLEIHL